jgi:uncharacterized radical SAM protein YgiQ
MQNDHVKWIPTTSKEVEQLGWDELDVILFSGDAYVDHPSFGSAVIARIILNEGYKVAVVPQPNWRDDLRDFRKLGKPRLFFGVTAGNMDSMVNHYTAAKRLRSDDAYTPGGKSGFRPDYPTVVYSKILKSLWPDVPVVIGGIEASMRRLTHYDYWKDKLEPSILIGSGADLLVYGMGEQPLRELLKLLGKGVPFNSLKTVPQTAYVLAHNEKLQVRKEWTDTRLHSYETCLHDKKAYAENFVAFEKESNRIEASRIIEPIGDKAVIVNPQFAPMDEREADLTYSLPYSYLPHPRYHKKGTIPAWEMIKFSVNIHRGCFGGCSFCAIAAHQGKHIVRRTEESVIQEITRISALDGFKGYLSDIGGPSANMFGMAGKDRNLCRRCSRPSCIWPSVCKNLDTDHSRLTALYKKVNSLPGIKKAFVGSGVRYDLLFSENNRNAGRGEAEYLRELIVNHVSGRLKVAPEHTEDSVLHAMRKAPFNTFPLLLKRFKEITAREGLKYELIPYFISSHPGCSENDMRSLSSKFSEMGLSPEQVQDFTPTPMTHATAVWYLGFDPYTGKRVWSAKSPEEKKRQKGWFFQNNKRWESTGAGNKKSRAATRRPRPGK